MEGPGRASDGRYEMGASQMIEVWISSRIVADWSLPPHSTWYFPGARWIVKRP